MTMIVLLVIAALSIFIAARGLKRPKDKVAAAVGFVLVILASWASYLSYQDSVGQSKRLAGVEAIQEPRGLSPSMREMIVERLSPYAGQHIDFSYIMNDAEAFAFAQEMEEVLTRAGWGIDTRGLSLGGVQPIIGVELRVSMNEAAQSALALAEALQEAGVMFKVGLSPPSPGGGPLWVVVGEKHTAVSPAE